VHEIFCMEEADIICNLVICPGRQNDKLIWVGTKNGAFFCSECLPFGKKVWRSGRGELLK
jgi:hypothetical protein